MKHLFKALLVGATIVAAPLAQAQEKVTLGGGPIAEVPQFIVANDRKLWDSRGLNVVVTPFATGRESFEALIGGQLDLAIMAEFPAVVGAMRDQKFAVVGVISRYVGNRIIVKADKPVASIADLAGKPVGVTIGTNTHFMLDEAVRKAGIKIETVNVGPPDIVPALVRGDIAAGAPFPSFYVGAKRTLAANYQEIAVPGYATTFLLVASRDFIEKHPDALTKVLSAINEGQGIVDADPAGAQQIVARVAGGATSLQAIQAAWPEYQFKLTLDADLLDLMTREGAWIKERGIIKNVEPTEALFKSHVSADALRAANAKAVTLP